MKVGTIVGVELERHNAALNDEFKQMVREKRLEIARRREDWQEIAEERLRKRGDYLIDSLTDFYYRPYVGSVWGPGTADVAYVPSGRPMVFYVDGHGQVRLLDRIRRPATWSERAAKKASAR